MYKKWPILVVVFSLLTFIISSLSSVLVFYSEQERTNINGNDILASKKIYKSTTITYENNNNLTLSSINSGYELIQNFSIANNNSDSIRYDILWTDVKNIQSTLDNNFIYNLNCSDGTNITNQVMPIEDTKIVSDIELATNKINNCTITIKYTSPTPEVLVNKSFGGTYKVVVKE